jgi:hypothetical protein
MGSRIRTCLRPAFLAAPAHVRLTPEGAMRQEKEMRNWAQKKFAIRKLGPELGQMLPKIA